MGKRKGRPPKKNPQDVQIAFMVTAEDAKRIESVFDKSGLNYRSDWLRNVVMAAVEKQLGKSS